MKPVFVGKEQIMRFYDSVNPDGKLAYSLWFGDRCMLQYPGEMDEEKARDFLETNIDAYDTAGWDNTLWLKFHTPQKEPVGRKTPVLIAQPVGFGDLSEEERSMSGTGGVTIYKGNNRGYDLEMFRAIKALEELPATVKTTIDDRFKEYDERLKAVEQPEAQEPTIMAQISGIVEKHPQIIEAVIGLLNRFTPNNPIQPGVPLAINGTPNMPEQQNPQPGANEAEPHPIDNDKLNAALDRLETKMNLDDDLTLLADFAERDPQQFAFLLTMLRNSK